MKGEQISHHRGQNEYIAGCYDRGIPALIEIKGSTEEKAVEVAQKTIEAIATMRAAGAFTVGGKERPEYWENMGMHSYSVEVVLAAKKAFRRCGVTLDVGITWLSDEARARTNPLAASALEYHVPGESWEMGGIRAAADLDCDYLFLMEPSHITKRIVDAAHRAGVKLYLYIRPNENSKDLQEKLLALGVDRLLF